MTDESVDATVPEFCDTSSERPRFRLQHLFALTAVMAVMLTVSAPFRVHPAGVEIPKLVELVLIGSGVVYSILSAIAITAAGYGLYWRRHRVPFLEQPGHWLLLEMAITALVGAVQQLAFRMASASFRSNLLAPNPSPPPSADMAFLIGLGLFSLVFIAVHVGLNIYFGRKQHERRWRSVFYLKAVAPFLWAIGMLIILLRLVRVVVLDRRESVSRDGAHWCGVVLQLAISGATILTSIGALALFWAQLRV